MKKYLIPDMYAQSIFYINYTHLKNIGIKCLLFDFDNTLTPYNIKEPSKELIELFKELDDMGFKLFILSNAMKYKLKPFKEILNVDTAYLSCKPWRFKYKKIMRLYGYTANEMAAIGDQLFTDVKGANRLGITSILVNPLSKKDSPFSLLNRLREKRVYKVFARECILEKGEYYE